MHRYRITAIVAAASLLLSSCGLFSSTTPKTKEDTVGPIKTLTTQSDVRSFYVQSDKKLYNYGRILAEPSPDTAFNSKLVSELAIKLKATKGDIGEVELRALQSLTKEVARLGVRSQGVIYLRDASYRLAESHMNGALLSAVSDANMADFKATLEEIEKSFPRPKSKADIRQRNEHLWRAKSQALESYAYTKTLNLILKNAKELIAHEINVNPTLSAITPAKQNRAAETEPRLTLTDKQTANTDFLVTYTNRHLANRQLTAKVSFYKSDGTTLGSSSALISLDRTGKGSARVKWLTDTDKVTVEAFASSPLSTTLKSIP